MKIEDRPVGEVRPYPKNPRQIPTRAIRQVAASIREFGWRQPIVADSDGIIIVGHVRYAAALEIGLESVPVHTADDLTPAQVKALRIADNSVGEASSWNQFLLASEVAGLDGFEFADFGVPEFSDSRDEIEDVDLSGGARFWVTISCPMRSRDDLIDRARRLAEGLPGADVESRE